MQRSLLKDVHSQMLQQKKKLLEILKQFIDRGLVKCVMEYSYNGIVHSL